mmetsp:Transcript_16564/g.24246  ORF Transcript_16564/g.24246 Transcript_16564/m.24246 type:complete len:202 (-) Transcript_16564:2245-2850(-)
MGDETITFHLSHAQSSTPSTTLQRLTSKHGYWPTGTRVNLVINQMLQSLVKCGSNEDASTQRPSSMPLINSFIAMFLVSHCMKTLADIFNSNVSKRSSITLATLKNDNFSKKTLNKLSDGHTRRNSVRIHNDVRYDAFCSKWHILLSIIHSDRSLLSVPRSKFVSNLRYTNVSNSNLRKSVPLFCCANHHIVHYTILVRFH